MLISYYANKKSSPRLPSWQPSLIFFNIPIESGTIIKPCTLKHFQVTYMLHKAGYWTTGLCLVSILHDHGCWCRIGLRGYKQHGIDLIVSKQTSFRFNSFNFIISKTMTILSTPRWANVGPMCLAIWVVSVFAVSTVSVDGLATTGNRTSAFTAIVSRCLSVYINGANCLIKTALISIFER